MGHRGGERRLVAVLFTDIVGSTEVASELGDARWRRLVTRHHEIVRRNLKRFDGRERDTAGDGFFATFEVPGDAVRCAVACQREVRDLGIDIRAGVSFGQVEQVDGKPGGLVVVGAARIMGVSGPGRLLVSSSVHDVLPGAAITFDDAGSHHLKGLDGGMHLYEVTAVDDEPVAGPIEDAERASELRDEASGLPDPRDRAPLLIVAGVIAVLAAVGAVLVLSRSSARTDPTTAGRPMNALVGIDPSSGEVRQTIPIEVQPVRVLNREVTHVGVAAEGGVWLARDTVVLHVDPEHDEVREPPVHHDTWLSGIPISVVAGAGELWASSDGVVRIDGATDETEPFMTLDTGRYGTDVAFGGGMIWITDSTGQLWRVDPEDPARVRRDELRSGDAYAVAADDASVWVADTFAGSITPIDPETMRQGDPVGFSTEITLLTVQDGEPWVLSAPSATVATVGSTNVARVGPSATSLAAGLGSLWVGDENGDVYRVDPDTFESTVIYRAGGRITTIVPDEERNVVWLDIGNAAD